MKTIKVACPVCGKPALDVRKYKDGSRLFIHRQRIDRAGMFAFCNIIESCMVKAPEKVV
jgi:hypothetical protein